MKVQVTEKGVFDPKGERIPVGTELDFEGDELPSPLVGKVRIISGGKTAVTNPAHTEEDLEALKAQADELGVEFSPTIGFKTLKERVDAVLAEKAGE